MLQRFMKSRGVAKFQRNRLAMASLAIIAVYFAVAFWIAAMEAIDWAGRASGAFTLRGVPVLGALLPEATLERAGPRWVAGFGVEQSVDRRIDQADQTLAPLRAAMADVGRVGDDTPRAAEILAGVRFAERRLVEGPPARVRELLDAAEAEFAALDVLKQRRSPVVAAMVGAERALQLAPRLSRVVEPGGWAEAAKVRGEAAAAVEDTMFAVEDAQAAAEDDGPFAEIDPIDLQDAVDRLLEDEPPGGDVDLIPMDLLRRVEALAQARVEVLDGEIRAQLQRLEARIDDLFPRPTGFAGAVYAARMSLGTDAQGRSILVRSIYSAKVAVQVGFVTALISVIIGALLGAAAAYFGGWVDAVVQWLYSTFSSVPNLVLLVVLAFMFTGTKVEGTLIPVYAAFCLTFWIGACRVIRGEVLKVKELEYVHAARATGFGRAYILVRHFLPNTTHLMFISFSLLFINAIKSEVILTFLGLGLKDGASWGIMINQSGPEVVQGFFWQIGAATVFMLVLVLAFNVVSDAMQDAFDPKHVG